MPPPSVSSTLSTQALTKSWMADASASLGQTPGPALSSSEVHFAEFLTWHLAMASVSAVVFTSPPATNFCWALWRQAAYLPASLFLPASHFWAGVAANALLGPPHAGAVHKSNAAV